MQRKLWTPGGDVEIDDNRQPRNQQTTEQIPEPRAPGQPRPHSEQAAWDDLGDFDDLGDLGDFDEEQVAQFRKMLEQLREVPVADLILNQINTLIQVAQLHLAPGETDEARLAIDCVKALINTVDDGFDDIRGQLDETVSQLQLLYVQAVSELQSNPPEHKGEKAN